uniref:Uncharacterized protein n=1 Tax=Rhizophora mucronata TaxID=61149 RepID=A0A2P2NDF6_RHIMU
MVDTCDCKKVVGYNIGAAFSC